MRKILAVAAVGAALFAGLAAPGTAGAATSHGAASSRTVIPMLGGRCEDSGWVRVNTSAVYIYTSTSTTAPHPWVAYRGAYLSCYPIVVGSAYRLCGTTTPANGWIPVDVDGDPSQDVDGFVPSTCVGNA